MSRTGKEWNRITMRIQKSLPYITDYLSPYAKVYTVINRPKDRTREMKHRTLEALLEHDLVRTKKVFNQRWIWLSPLGVELRDYLHRRQAERQCKSDH